MLGRRRLVVFAELSDAISAIQTHLHEEIRQVRDQIENHLPHERPLGRTDQHLVGYRDGLLRALAIIEDHTQPDDYT